MKNWCFWTVVLEKTLESPLDCKEIQPGHPKGDQSWVFIGRTDVEAETPILWPRDVNNWLIWKDPDAGKDWRWEEKGTTGWDGWMVWPTQWTWIWVDSRSWWWTGRPGVLQSTGSQSRTQLSDWTELSKSISSHKCNLLLWNSSCSIVKNPPEFAQNSRPLSQWCHPTISSSIVPFSPCLQSFPASGFFKCVGSSHQVAEVLELQLQHQSFQWIFRSDFL